MKHLMKIDHYFTNTGYFWTVQQVKNMLFKNIKYDRLRKNSGGCNNTTAMPRTSKRGKSSNKSV